MTTAVMHRPAVTTLILLAFAASAVFGLCAMTQQMMMHGGLCTTGSIGSMVCPENPLRHLSLLAVVLAVLAVSVCISAAGSVPLAPVALSVPRWRKRALLSHAYSPGLLQFFSDGILNPKAF